MDAGVVDEVDDGPVALLVLVAKVLSQVDEQLSAHGLIAVHVGDIFKLRLACEEEKNKILLLFRRANTSVSIQLIISIFTFMTLLFLSYTSL